MSDTNLSKRLLLKAGLRPTRKRAQLADLLFDGPDKHVSAEEVMAAAQEAGIEVSFATVYNCLNQFSAAGLLRRITVDGVRVTFDTNTDDHHHIYYEDTGELVDIPGDRITVRGMPKLARDVAVQSVEVTIRVRKDNADKP